MPDGFLLRVQLIIHGVDCCLGILPQPSDHCRPTSWVTSVGSSLVVAAVVVPSQALKCPLLCRLTWLRSEHSVFLHWAIYSSVADMQLNKSMSNSSTMALLHASRSMAGLPQLCRGTSAFSASASLELLVLQHCPPPLLPPAFLPHPCLCPAIGKLNSVLHNAGKDQHKITNYTLSTIGLVASSYPCPCG